MKVRPVLRCWRGPSSAWLPCRLLTPPMSPSRRRATLLSPRSESDSERRPACDNGEPSRERGASAGDFGDTQHNTGQHRRPQRVSGWSYEPTWGAY